MAIEVQRYAAEDACQWDDFLKASKNGTFLFQRGFMDYHADRFQDHSLMIHEDGKLLAVMPANADSSVLNSHGGLTYGGVVSGAKMSAERMLAVFDALGVYLRAAGFTGVNYKAVPYIYHSQPADEDIYALFRHGAQAVRTDVSATIAVPRRLPFGSGKKDGLRKARKAGLEIRESTDWSACWTLLTQVLDDRHNARPVHSEAEIRLLAARFPDQIRMFGSFDNDRMIAAVVVFDCGRTVHVQYIAASEQGRLKGGVDLIVHHLLDTVFTGSAWLDFGISTTDQGRILNTGLAKQKEMFGARSTVYQQYRWQLT
ncbi:GNAT family N-acetyltransferase [Leisingera methylohalidivorans]|uniref:GNAT family N-acetyltransferase n=1 Tax=Leisingera methylohalidivorans TaxID=133924 RepID=UPI0004183441|nr:GNAT family N-acetyltransferase [Leisingera methylohalidivorans]